MDSNAGRRPAAVLWDMDGTLVDTEPYWIACEFELAERHGGTWTHDHALGIVGMDLMDAGRYIREHAGIDITPEQIVEELLDGVIARVRQSIPWRPGARELLGQLQDTGSCELRADCPPWVPWVPTQRVEPGAPESRDLHTAVSLQMLACTVRGCGEPLKQSGRTMACRRGHSFDLARGGYVNLLQPQDRRSRDAGDSADTVAARARLWTAGVGRTLVDAVITAADTLALPERAGVVDLGCGGGHLLAALAAERPIDGVGIDLSAAAVSHAAHLSPDLTWVVANADRRLPVLDGAASLAVSLHARRNPAECFRALSPDGRLLVAVPAADDLIELRAIVQGQGTARDRVDALIAAHAELFTVVQQEAVRGEHHVSAEVLRDLLRVTYRGRRYAGRPIADELRDMDLTIASDVVVFAPRR